ncbi:MAG: hypothetical protein ACLFNJ_10210 [Bacteroidales bacterium]
MHVYLEYRLPDIYRDFPARMIIFFRRNILLYIPDFILLIFLSIPPYSWQKTLYIATGLVVLSLRDVVAMKRLTRYLDHFKIENLFVDYSILKYSRVYEKRRVHISKVNLNLSTRKKPYKLEIYEGEKIIHVQYAIGYYSLGKLKEIYNNFHSLKKELDLGVMFRGATLN